MGAGLGAGRPRRRAQLRGLRLARDRGHLAGRHPDAGTHRPPDPSPTAPDHPGPGADDQCAASDHQHATGDDGATFHRSTLEHDGPAIDDRDSHPDV